MSKDKPLKKTLQRGLRMSSSLSADELEETKEPEKSIDPVALAARFGKKKETTTPTNEGREPSTTEVGSPEPPRGRVFAQALQGIASEEFAVDLARDKADPMAYLMSDRTTFGLAGMSSLLVDDYRTLCRLLGVDQKALFVRMFRMFGKALPDEELQKASEMAGADKREATLEELRRLKIRISTLPDWDKMVRRKTSK